MACSAFARPVFVKFILLVQTPGISRDTGFRLVCYCEASLVSLFDCLCIRVQAIVWKVI